MNEVGGSIYYYKLGMTLWSGAGPVEIMRLEVGVSPPHDLLYQDIFYDNIAIIMFPTRLYKVHYTMTISSSFYEGLNSRIYYVSNPTELQYT